MVTCRTLLSHELPIYGKFLKNRNLHSRRMYFGYCISDYAIDLLAQNIIKDSSKHNIIIAEDNDLEIVGTVHIAEVNSSNIEFGVMVAEESRNQGISGTLIEYAITWAQNRQFDNIYMHCLSYNAPIRHLVNKYKLEFTKEENNTTAVVKIPPVSIVSLSKESLMMQSSAIKNSLLKFKRPVTM